MIEPTSSKRRLCERLFGAGRRPHVFTVHKSDHLSWLLDPANLRRLRDNAFGHIIFWARLYTSNQEPDGGHYVYADPATVARAQALVRDYGFGVIGYVAGWHWRQAGLGPFALLDEIDRHGWDGVMLDNGQVGRNVWETWDFMLRLRARVRTIIHHASVEPHFARSGYRGPWAALEDYTIWGETNPLITQPGDPAWRHYVSQAERVDSSAIGLYKPNEAVIPRPDPATWYPLQPQLLSSVRASIWMLPNWEKHFWPAWLARAERYRHDPEQFIANALS